LLKQVLLLSPVEETEATLLGLDEQLTRFANNTIRQHVVEMNRYIVVRAIEGQRIGVAASNDLTREGLERLVESASRAAEASPECRTSPVCQNPPVFPESKPLISSRLPTVLPTGQSP
jgi:predicted Zn-dependent protease